MLLDEPSLGLAPKLVEEIFQIIKNINREGITVLLVEQNANKALGIAHYGYVLETGSVTLADEADGCDERSRTSLLPRRVGDFPWKGRRGTHAKTPGWY